MQVIEARQHPCDICSAAHSLYMTLCAQPDGEEPQLDYCFNGIKIERAFMLNTCENCKDKITHRIIPLPVCMDSGYYYANPNLNILKTGLAK